MPVGFIGPEAAYRRQFGMAAIFLLIDQPVTAKRQAHHIAARRRSIREIGGPGKFKAYGRPCHAIQIGSFCPKEYKDYSGQ